MAEKVGDIFVTLGADASGFKGGMNEAVEAIAEFAKSGDALLSLGPKLGASLAGIELGKILLEAAEDSERAGARIRGATGLTGDALAQLRESAARAASGVSESEVDIAEAISRIAVRLGQTGPAAEKFVHSVSDLNQATGGDFKQTLEGSIDALNGYQVGIESSDDALNILLRTTQASGIRIGELLGNLRDGGPILRELGFSFEQSAALLGELDKQGIAATPTIRALKQAIQDISTVPGEGVQSFKGIVENIKNTTDATERLRKSINVFGESAGPVFANIISKGALDIDQLTESLNRQTDTVAKAGEETETFGDKGAKAFKNLKASVGTFVSGGLTVFSALGEAASAGLGVVEAAAAPALNAIKTIGDATAKASRDANAALNDLSGGAGAATPTIQSVGQAGKDAASGINELKAAASGVGAAVGAGADAANAKIDAVTQGISGLVTKGLGIIRAQAQLVGPSFDEAGAKAQLFQQVVAALIASGKRFEDSYKAATAQLGDFNALVGQSTATKLSADLADAANRASVFGTKIADLSEVLKQFPSFGAELAQELASLTQMGSKIQSVGNAVVALKNAGKENTQEFKDLSKQLDALRANAKIEFDADFGGINDKIEAIRNDASIHGATLTVQANTQAAQQALNALKSAADTLFPPGSPKRIEVDAEIAKAQKKLDELQKQAETPAVKPIEADTKPFEKALSEAEQRQQDINSHTPELGGKTAVNFLTEVGTAASPQETLNAVRTFAREVGDALKQGDVERLQALRENGQAFVDNFKSSILKLSALTANSSNFGRFDPLTQALREIQDVVGSLRFIGLGKFAGGDAVDLSIALHDFLTKQGETNSLLHENNDLTRANIDASRGISSALTTGNIRSALTEKTRQATGVRGL